MSGWGAINMNADDNTGTANVKLHFMAAKDRNAESYYRWQERRALCRH